jgi:hypothetical protein
MRNNKAERLCAARLLFPVKEQEEEIGILVSKDFCFSKFRPRAASSAFYGQPIIVY